MLKQVGDVCGDIYALDCHACILACSNNYSKLLPDCSRKLSVVTVAVEGLQGPLHSNLGVPQRWCYALNPFQYVRCCPNAENDTEAAAEAKKYATFWKEFGKAIRLGIVEDVQNRQRLAKLLRFETSKSDSKEIGLDAYIANMKEGQKSIYYLAGQATSRFLLFGKSVSLVYYFLAVLFALS